MKLCLSLFSTFLTIWLFTCLLVQPTDGQRGRGRGPLVSTSDGATGLKVDTIVPSHDSLRARGVGSKPFGKRNDGKSAMMFTSSYEDGRTQEYAPVIKDELMPPADSVPQLELFPSHFELYQECRGSMDCLNNIPNSMCDYFTRLCVCQQYHVPYNNSVCLPPSLLGYACAVDSQCRVKVKHSRCIDGICSCEANHIPLRKDKCLPPAVVGDYCVKDMQCSYASSYSFCKYILPRVYGKCECPLGYLITEEKTCKPHLESPCHNHDDCQLATENSFCEKNNETAVCKCMEGYEPSSNLLTCKKIERETMIFTEEPVTVKISSGESETVISLGRACEMDEECTARDPYTYCLNGTCECIAPDDECSAKNPGCYEDTFQCRNGFCISWFFVCDGTNNCADNSDEDECIPHQCPTVAFTCDDGTCKSRAAVCNGYWECPDGSDEARCYTGIPCDKNAFRCKNGQCLPSYALCNSEQNCADGSDELQDMCDLGQNCTGRGAYQCDNGHCRATSILCSGMDGCGDNTDETLCEACYCKKP